MGVDRSRVFILGGRASNFLFVPGLIEHANDVGEVLPGELRVDGRGLNVGVPEIGLNGAEIAARAPMEFHPAPMTERMGMELRDSDSARDDFHALPDALTEDASLDHVPPTGAIPDDEQRGTGRGLGCLQAPDRRQQYRKDVPGTARVHERG